MAKRKTSLQTITEYLNDKGYDVRDVPRDGQCFFYAINMANPANPPEDSDVYPEEEIAAGDRLREKIMDFGIELLSTVSKIRYFARFVTGDTDTVLKGHVREKDAWYRDRDCLEFFVEQASEVGNTAEKWIKYLTFMKNREEWANNAIMWLAATYLKKPIVSILSVDGSVCYPIMFFPLRVWAKVPDVDAENKNRFVIKDGKKELLLKDFIEPVTDKMRGVEGDFVIGNTNNMHFVAGILRPENRPIHNRDDLESEVRKTPQSEGPTPLVGISSSRPFAFISTLQPPKNTAPDATVAGAISISSAGSAQPAMNDDYVEDSVISVVLDSAPVNDEEMQDTEFLPDETGHVPWESAFTDEEEDEYIEPSQYRREPEVNIKRKSLERALESIEILPAKPKKQKVVHEVSHAVEPLPKNPVSQWPARIAEIMMRVCGNRNVFADSVHFEEIPGAIPWYTHTEDERVDTYTSSLPPVSYTRWLEKAYDGEKAQCTDEDATARETWCVILHEKIQNSFSGCAERWESTYPGDLSLDAFLHFYDDNFVREILQTTATCMQASFDVKQTRIRSPTDSASFEVGQKIDNFIRDKAGAALATKVHHNWVKRLSTYLIRLAAGCLFSGTTKVTDILSFAEYVAENCGNPVDHAIYLNDPQFRALAVCKAIAPLWAQCVLNVDIEKTPRSADDPPVDEETETILTEGCIALHKDYLESEIDNGAKGTVPAYEKWQLWDPIFVDVYKILESTVFATGKDLADVVYAHGSLYDEFYGVEYDEILAVQYRGTPSYMQSAKALHDVLLRRVRLTPAKHVPSYSAPLLESTKNITWDQEDCVYAYCVVSSSVPFEVETSWRVNSGNVSKQGPRMLIRSVPYAVKNLIPSQKAALGAFLGVVDSWTRVMTTARYVVVSAVCLSPPFSMDLNRLDLECSYSFPSLMLTRNPGVSVGTMKIGFDCAHCGQRAEKVIPRYVPGKSQCRFVRSTTRSTEKPLLETVYRELCAGKWDNNVSQWVVLRIAREVRDLFARASGWKMEDVGEHILVSGIPPQEQLRDMHSFILYLEKQYDSGKDEPFHESVRNLIRFKGMLLDTAQHLVKPTCRITDRPADPELIMRLWGITDENAIEAWQLYIDQLSVENPRTYADFLRYGQYFVVSSYHANKSPVDMLITHMKDSKKLCEIYSSIKTLQNHMERIEKSGVVCFDEAVRHLRKRHVNLSEQCTLRELLRMTERYPSSSRCMTKTKILADILGTSPDEPEVSVCSNVWYGRSHVPFPEPAYPATFCGYSGLDVSVHPEGLTLDDTMVSFFESVQKSATAVTIDNIVERFLDLGYDRSANNTAKQIFLVEEIKRYWMYGFRRTRMDTLRMICEAVLSFNKSYVK
jgi:hypothetical protein